MSERGRLSRRGFVGAAAGTAAATSLGPWAPVAGAMADTVTMATGSCRGT